MRRVAASREEHEHGAAAVIVALLMVVLLGFGALAIDVGLLYSEKAQLQNGADAGALAIAQTCAKDEGSAACASPMSLAKGFADLNSLDSLSNVQPVDLDTTNNKVTVTTDALEAGRTDNRVSLYFADVLGIADAAVTASSSAAWGIPSGGNMILPLAIAECKFNLAPDTSTSAPQLLEMDDGGCGEIPGGFGWIEGDTDADCGITLAAGASDDPGIWFESDTGASVPSACTSADLALMKDETVFFPLYDVATGTGAGGKYYIKGFAAFHVTGYRFPSQTWWPNVGDGISSCNKCLRGYFVEFVSLSHDLDLGDAPDYGTSVVKLTN